jgi:hypothetical protein
MSLESRSSRRSRSPLGPTTSIAPSTSPTFSLLDLRDFYSNIIHSGSGERKPIYSDSTGAQQHDNARLSLKPPSGDCQRHLQVSHGRRAVGIWRPRCYYQPWEGCHVGSIPGFQLTTASCMLSSIKIWAKYGRGRISSGATRRSVSSSCRKNA